MQTKWHGFTLIELLIVVIVISVISAIGIPRLLSRLNPAEEFAPSAELPFAEDRGEEELSRPRGVLPVIDSAQLGVQLQAQTQRVGIDVVNRYRAEVRGTLAVSAHEPNGVLTRIEVPFPESVTEIVEFSIMLHGRGRDGAPEPGELELRPDGFQWVGDLSTDPDDDAPLQVRFDYVVRGEDRFTLSLPPARQLRQVDVDVHIAGLPGSTAGEGSLVPTTQTDESLHWSFNNLVSSRPIEVLFPGTESPLGQAMRLFQLAGLAVLLFGAGFWYLGELYDPGRLDSFRWGHFFLLAVTYVFFFVVLAVLGYRGWQPMESLGASALIALPLLLFHVSTIFDHRFAWTRALPLAALTMLVVANGVYGGPNKMFVYLGAAATVVAALTLTYPILHRRAEEKHGQREDALRQSMDALLEKAVPASELCEQAGASLQVEDPSTMQRLRDKLETAGATLEEHLRDVAVLAAARETTAPRPGRSERRRQIDSAKRSVSDLRAALDRGQQELRAALDHARRGREKTEQRLQSRDEHPVHCPSCGGGLGDARFCAGCGQEAPVVRSCKCCGQELRLPRELLANDVSFGNLHCMSCGEFPRSQAVAVAQA